MSVPGRVRSARAGGAVAVLSACGASSGVDAAAPEPVGAFVHVALGEYNNHEQVVEQARSPPEPGRWPHRHYRARVADAAETAGDTAAALWLTSQVGDASEAEDGLRWRALGVVTPHPSAPGAVRMVLRRDAGRTAELSGCELVWMPREGGYDGRAAAACAAFLPSAERRFLLGRRHRLDAEGLRVGEVLHRRVRYFTGWIAMRRAGLGPAADGDADWVFASGLRAHGEGQLVPLLDGARPTGYAVQLERLTYRSRSQPSVPVLKLGIVEQSSGDTVAYSWTGPDADRIGLNLRWIQSGMSVERSAPAR